MSNKSATGTITGKDMFMQNIASRLGRKEPLQAPPVSPIQGVPEHYRAIDLNVQEKIELFAHNWTALSGQVLIVNKDEASETIGAYLENVLIEQQVTGVSLWDHPELMALSLEDRIQGLNVSAVPWRDLGVEEVSHTLEKTNWSRRSKLLQATERCEMGIVHPDYAIANTGTLVLQARGGKGRSVSLLPSILFAIFPADRLVTRMGEALHRIRLAYPANEDLPSSINMITGPSRSADIENDLTIGVHGPGKVYAVIVV
jgi:L-lactate dehydrogenase complex protein LldG